MAAAETPAFLPEAVVYLGASVVLVPLFIRFKLGAVLGYLAAGIIIGPSLLGLVSEPEQVLKFAEFGIVLLLFVIGLELQPSRLWALRRDIFGLGAAQVILCGLALTGLVMAMTSFTWQAALVVGLPLGLSSTALVMQLLNERKIAGTAFGERSFSMLLFQDLAIVPLLTIVAALSRVPDPDALPGWQMAAMTVAALVFLVLVGRFLLPPVFRIIGTLGAREAFVAAALLSVLGSALLMASLGLSMALGAFVAGVMLAESPYRHALEADIEPFRGLLLGLFFVAIGMTLDLGVVRAQWALIITLVIGVMAVKTGVIFALARAFGTGTTRAFQMGLLLSQGGEFGFVLFAEAARGMLISASAAQLFGAVVTVSMAVTPLIFLLASRIRISEAAGAIPDGPETAGHDGGDRGRAIIVGGGRFGQVVAQMLAARGVGVTTIDLDAELIDVSRQFGVKVYYGDGRRTDILRAAGIENASLLVFAIDGAWDPAVTLGPIRNQWPELPILARAFDRMHLLALRHAGVETVVRETFESGIAMGREALGALGTPDELIDAIEGEFRRRDSERLDLQLCSDDPTTGSDTLIRSALTFDPVALGEIPMEEA
ncbi:monovalent cation:proton antiporter-2 (CPA2) family protein [Polymorphobacter fuscus]|uniref:monovalent cation:proton antiporter-2 (CPA2) family protein n=1 Tax=Sandarakinorhabdus fusca TaxID=1439888 RepID=UPI0016BD4EC3|nr:monovalent cation:proton antiporter-2 (CPA2) family protein [Polymorphobacter fuscus]NJC09643.1 monovalent cation:proton antiporter-2 (CPA2) family protein [Polymorphobacter fuscus]